MRHRFAYLGSFRTTPAHVCAHNTVQMTINETQTRARRASSKRPPRSAAASAFPLISREVECGPKCAFGRGGWGAWGCVAVHPRRRSVFFVWNDGDGNLLICLLCEPPPCQEPGHPHGAVFLLFIPGRPTWGTLLIPRGGALVFAKIQERTVKTAKCGQNRGFPRVFACFTEQNWQKNQPGAAPEHLKEAISGF